MLAGGAVAADEIKRLAKGAGIASRTLWRAKGKIGVKSFKEGMSDMWKWRLGDEGCHEECQVNNVAAFEECHQKAKGAMCATWGERNLRRPAANASDQEQLRRHDDGGCSK